MSDVVRKIKFCDVCGKKIPELSTRKRVCSEACRAKKKRGYAPYKDCSEPPCNDLTSIQEKAHKAGLSYGQYVATTERGVERCR